MSVNKSFPLGIILIDREYNLKQFYKSSSIARPLSLLSTSLSLAFIAMEALQDIGVFFAETLIIVVALIAIIITIAGLAAKSKQDKSFEIERLDEKFKERSQFLKESLLDEASLKEEKKRLKKEKKEEESKSTSEQKRVFVIDFLKGDIKASEGDNLRDEITTVLGVARKDDEVCIRLFSPGGLVHSYGFAAAQLVRIRDAGIKLTVCVDQVAASGGYMMACTAHQILASPFALIGSIGVVAQVPNFNRLLKKYDVDYKEYTAGDYKRTVSIFGEITPKGEEKFKEQLELTHQLFKGFVGRFRPQLDLAKVATGEYWYGETALSLGLVDKLQTSDDYLLSKSKEHQIVKISFEEKPKWTDKLSEALSRAVTMTLAKIIDQNSITKKF